MADIQRNVDLKPFNTFGIPVNARYFTVINSVRDLVELIHTDLFRNERNLILGGGSNILFTKNFDGLVIHNNLKGITFSGETDQLISVTVASGEPWHPFVLHCVRHGWGGIENLALIPGTVGAAPIQNIGAYGVELKEVVEKVKGVELATGNERSFNKAECLFGYRESIFKHELKENFFISSVTLTLTRNKHNLRTDYGTIRTTLSEMHIAHPTIQSVCDAVIQIRSQKLPDPKVLGNSGSFFKNPVVPIEKYNALQKSHHNIPGYASENQLVKIPAAWLIEQCGWKGKRIDKAGVHHMQALVLVNYGGATGEDILDLSRQIQEDVEHNFGIFLAPEVNIM